jgi:hypothetical protein
MSEFIQQPELHCRMHWRNRKAFASQRFRHAILKLACIRDLSCRMDWAASSDLRAISAANRLLGRGHL